MPIRTNRGRAAVYRKLWGWPLRSPKHLVGAVVLGIATVGLLGWVVPQVAGTGGGAPSPTVAGPGSSSAASTATPTGTRPPDVGPGAPSGTGPTSLVPRATTPTPSSAPAAPEALAVAEAWARAWVNHPAGMTTDAWVAQLAPLTTEEYLPQLRTVDPANVPSSAVTGPATAVTAAVAAVEATVPTDAAVLRLTVIATDTGWRVTASTLAE